MITTDRIDLPDGYDPVAKTLHWLLAALIVTQFTIGWTMPDVERDARASGLMIGHLAVGVAIVIAVAIRLLWRATHRVAPLKTHGRIARLGRATHGLLYLLLVAVPLLGWANTSARGWIASLGPLALPRILPAGSEIGFQMGNVHSGAAILLAVVVLLHLSAAVYHQFILRDGTLRRML